MNGFEQVAAAMTAVPQCQCRWMLRRDMQDVLDIEQRSFGDPWTKDDFMTCLRQRNCIGMVAEYQEEVIGFFVYELLKGSLHVLNFAVSPQHRRLGVGGTMVEKLKAKLHQQRRTELSVCVRDANLQAQLFWRSQGFGCVETIRGYYCNGDDAYRFLFCV